MREIFMLKKLEGAKYVSQIYDVLKDPLSHRISLVIISINFR